jgi:tRNA-specific 2-thiouridylase
LQDALHPGPIVRRDGTVVGAHEGLPLYTFGQRRGLKVGGLKIPLEVVAKDAGRNALIVADRGNEQIKEAKICDIAWISWKPKECTNIPLECRTRSLSKRLQGSFTYEGNTGTFAFHSPQPPQSPGQSLVLYKNEEIVGGGILQ